MAGKITRPKNPISPSRTFDEVPEYARADWLRAVRAEVGATCETVEVSNKALRDASEKVKSIQAPLPGRTAGS